MNSNNGETSAPPNPDSTDAKQKKHSRVIGHIIRYTVYTIFATVWAVVGLLGSMTLAHIATAIESASDIYHIFSTYRPGFVELVALVALILMWGASMWVLKKARSKPPSPKTPESLPSVSPQSNSAQIQREKTIRHRISATACVMIVFLICITIIARAGEISISTGGITIFNWLIGGSDSNLTPESLITAFNSLTEDGYLKLIAFMGAVLISILALYIIGRFVLKIPLRIWELMKNLFGF